MEVARPPRWLSNGPEDQEIHDAGMLRLSSITFPSLARVPVGTISTSARSLVMLRMLSTRAVSRLAATLLTSARNVNLSASRILHLRHL